MSFEQQSNSNIESELNELRINSMIKALGTQREQALNQAAKLLGDLAVEKARVTILDSALTSANSKLEALAAAHALLSSKVSKLEALLENREAELTRYTAAASLVGINGNGFSTGPVPTGLTLIGTGFSKAACPTVNASSTDISSKYTVPEEVLVKHESNAQAMLVPGQDDQPMQ